MITIVIGHATFCVVVVYNNVIARLRRTPGSLVEASDGPRRRRVADVPVRHVSRGLSTALVAGGLLAFALSFDELIVTNFTAGRIETTIPKFIYNNMRQPRNRPIVNVVAVVVILVMVIPVYIAQRLAGGGASGGGRAAQRAALRAEAEPGL